MTIEQTPVIEIPADPKIRERLKGAVEEMSGLMLQKSSLTEMIKDIGDAIHAEYAFPKKALRALATAHFKENMKEKAQEAEELSEAYDILMGSST